MERLLRYFTEGVRSFALGESVGMEIETQFVGFDERPVSVEDSQFILNQLVSEDGWQVSARRSALITELVRPGTGKVLYELGRHNIEVSLDPAPADQIVARAEDVLGKLYAAAHRTDGNPFFFPVLETDEDALVVPDQRDATWLRLDGRAALNLLARTSSVQFTIATDPARAIRELNALGAALPEFLVGARWGRPDCLPGYPQDILWRRYIAESHAGYDPLRYGGPLRFESLEDYCAKLARQPVVFGDRLTPFAEAGEFDIPLFIRSVWWHFRLKRYDRALCIEVRPMGRWSDDRFSHQLWFVTRTLRSA